MSSNFDLVISQSQVVFPDPKTGVLKIEKTDVGVRDGKIAHIGPITDSPKDRTIRAEGLHLLPGAIDTQVHFRDPGFPEKEDLSSGTRSAIAGGVTSVFEMPNTNPPTLTAIDVSDKITRAKEKAWCDYAFYVGASPSNIDKLTDLEKLPGVCGVKMFLGSSTGNLVVGNYENAARVLKATKRRVAIHSEDDARLTERKKIAEESHDVKMHPVWRDVESAVIATRTILEAAQKLNHPVHILHVSAAEEFEILRAARAHKELVTVEVTPQHLTLFAPDCYEKLGTLAQMNPPIREKRHLEAAWKALLDGTVDVIGSDHAPHTLKEKAAEYPKSPSGLTGVQTLLPLMLHHCVTGKHAGLTLQKVVELTAQNPARIWGIDNKGEIRVGFDADLALVDLKNKFTITNSWIQSRCGWTPYDGMELNAQVKGTILRGNVVMRDNEILGLPRGKALTFRL